MLFPLAQKQKTTTRLNEQRRRVEPDAMSVPDTPGHLFKIAAMVFGADALLIINRRLDALEVYKVSESI